MQGSLASQDPHLHLFLFRPGSLIVEFKVGVQDSQAKLMIAEAKKLLKTFTKFDHSYFAAKDPQGLLSSLLQTQKSHIQPNIQLCVILLLFSEKLK